MESQQVIMFTRLVELFATSGILNALTVGFSFVPVNPGRTSFSFNRMLLFVTLLHQPELPQG
jgi:hypothetical protein